MPTPLVALCAGGVCSTLLFVPDPLFLLLALQKWHLCFLGFLVECAPSAQARSYSWCSKRHLSRSKHCSKGSWVPACLTFIKSNPDSLTWHLAHSGSFSISQTPFEAKCGHVNKCWPMAYNWRHYLKFLGSVIK